MTEKTKNYNLLQPSGDDYYNIEDFNQNMSTIDSELKKNADGIQTANQVANEAKGLAINGGKQYIMPRPPVDGGDIDYPIGTQWFIPQITLHNKVNNPTLSTMDGWRVVNGTAAVSGGAVSTTGGNGAAYIRLEQDITGNFADHVIYLQSTVKVSSTASLSKLSVYITFEGTKQIVKEITSGFTTNEVDLYEQITADTKFNNGFTLTIEALYTSTSTANGKILTVKNPCLIDENVDFSMGFSKQEELSAEYLHNHVGQVLAKGQGMFTILEYGYSNQRYTKTTDLGWMLGDGLSQATKNAFKADTVDGALKKILTFIPISYLAWCANANANTDSLDAAFGKNNESDILNIGKQLAMYAWFKGESKTSKPFTNLMTKQTLNDIAASPEAVSEAEKSDSICTLMYLSPYAMTYNYKKSDDIIFYSNTINKLGIFTVSGPSSYTVNSDGLVFSASGPGTWGAGLSSSLGDLFKLHRYINIEYSKVGSESVFLTTLTVGGIGIQTSTGGTSGYSVSHATIKSKINTISNKSGLAIYMNLPYTSNHSCTTTIHKIWLSNI